jgi:hypothetical protein
MEWDGRGLIDMKRKWGIDCLSLSLSLSLFFFSLSLCVRVCEKEKEGERCAKQERKERIK